MAEYKDYYKVLGVPRKATDKEIKDAYRKLARKYHPDVNPGDKKSEDQFKQIGEAYDVLGHADKRKKYDQLGTLYSGVGTGANRGAGSPFTQTRPGAAPGTRVDLGDLGGDTGGFGGVGDLFESLFGQGNTTRTRSTRGAAASTFEFPLDVTLVEAYTGAEKTLDIDAGSPCPYCRGTGRIGLNECPNCQGKGREERRLKVTVKIPAGVDTGARIAARSAAPSPANVSLLVRVLPDTQFQREGNDLHTEPKVDLTVAVLGGEVAVPTPGGKKLMLKIPAESANGQQFVLRGQGMPKLNQTGRGDLFAKLHVVLPKHLTEREKELFQELASGRVAAPASR